MTTPSKKPASLVEMVALKREAVAYAVMAAGVLLLILAIFWSIRWYNGRDQASAKPAPTATQDSEAPEEKKEETERVTDKGDYLPAAIWSALLALLFVGSGAWQATRKPDEATAVFDCRVWIMMLGGIASFLTSVLGFVLLWRWQESLLLWVNKGEIREARWVMAGLSIFLSSLALLFGSTQVARSEERTNLLMRRLLYGSNAVLTGVLLLLMLVVVNVIVFMKLPDNVVTTAAGFKGLSDSSKEFLRTINDPVKIYLVLPETNIEDLPSDMYTSLYLDCRSLLRACEDENKNIKAVYLNPAIDNDEIKSTFKRLKTTPAYGILIAYGEHEDLTEFIPIMQLIRSVRRVAVFQGEAQLMTQINFLAGGGKRPVLYFTQGNGEPAIGGVKEGNQRSCKEIVTYLTERKFDIKPLFLEEGKRVDLSDAALVVVAAPRIPFRPEQVQILSDYLTPRAPNATGGKILAFLPAFPDSRGNVSPTGLEALLGDWGIYSQGKVFYEGRRGKIDSGVNIEGMKRIFSFPEQQIPTDWVRGSLTPELLEKRHALTRVSLFATTEGLETFEVSNVRPVFQGTSRPGTTASNLFSNAGRVIYFDSVFNSNTDEVVALIRKEAKDNIFKTSTEKQLTKLPIPFAAYTYEEAPVEGGVRERWRVAAIGSDWFINDDFLRVAQQRPEYYMRVVALLCDVMREHPESMKIEPRALGTFDLPKETNQAGLIVLPIGLALLGIIALGTGVWVARRK